MVLVLVAPQSKSESYRNVTLFFISKGIQKSPKTDPKQVFFGAVVSTRVSTANQVSATVSIVCYKRKTLSNGEHPLMRCICKDRKHKYQSIGVDINPIYLDFNKYKLKF